MIDRVFLISKTRIFEAEMREAPYYRGYNEDM